MNKFLAVVGMILALALGFAAWGTWRWATNLRVTDLAAWALLATLALPVFFGLGFYMGKVQVTGFFQGVDTAMDKLFTAVSKVNQEKVAHTRAIRQVKEEPAQGYNVRGAVLPNTQPPQLVFKVTKDDEIIDA